MSAETDIVGLTLEEAKKLVLSGDTIFLQEGIFVTMDWRPERTRIWYSPVTNKVTRVTKG